MLRWRAVRLLIDGRRGAGAGAGYELIISGMVRDGIGKS
jgi:hypothetical protein